MSIHRALPDVLIAYFSMTYVPKANSLSVLNKKALNLSDLNIPSVDNGYLLIARDSAAAKDLHVGKYVKRLNG